MVDDVRTQAVTRTGILPNDFYSTTNLPTQVRLDSRWVQVERQEMDVAIVVDPRQGRAYCKPMHRVAAGDQVVVGEAGVRVTSLKKVRDADPFGFMDGAVSSERPKGPSIRRVADQMRAIHARGGRIAFVLGPAVVNSGGRDSMAALIRAGYVDVLFGGNAVATHDIESDMYGTFLGMDLETGRPVDGGHCNHIRAINTVTRLGSLRTAVESGVVRQGIMYECVTNEVDFVLAGSIRDDGPLPDVITDTRMAQERMRASLDGVEMVVMVATMLHSIAVGNLLSAKVRTVAVDISPAVVTKLMDRGTHQAEGIVTDAAYFVHQLCVELALSPLGAICLASPAKETSSQSPGHNNGHRPEGVLGPTPQSG
jgi:lysine-ketoglutarate reductase/saccharopine dehydrogenase-like protein (TIGR00300 family)